MLKSVLLAGCALMALAVGPVMAQERVRLDSTVQGELIKGDDQLDSGEFLDVYEFEGRQGQQLTLRMRSADFDPYVMIRGPGDFSEDNDDASDDDTDSLLTVRLPADGTYRISATSFEAGESGRYDLSILAGSAAGPRPAAEQAGILRSGSAVRGDLGRGDDTLDTGEFVDTWTLSGRRGQTFDLRLRSGDFDPYLMVRGPGGLSADNDDDPQRGSRDSRLQITLPADGEVRVSATSYARGETGAYALSVDEADGPDDRAPVTVSTEGRLRLGQTVAGELAAGDPRLSGGEYLNTFTLDGRRGQQLDLRLSSTAFDPYLMIRGPGDFAAENDDDAAGGVDSRLLVTLPADGAYQVTATSYAAGERGAYRLAVLDGTGAVAPPPARPASHGDGAIRIGDAVSGALAGGDETLSSGEYVDDYRFTGRRGQRVAVDLTSSAFDAYTILIAPSGEQIDNDDGADGTDSHIETALAEDGEYTVRVTSYAAGETGSYRFSVAPSEGSARQAAVRGGARVFAVMVGVSDYGDAQNDLPYTDEDAEKLADALRREGVLNPASVVLTNAEATVGGVEAAFARVAAQAGPDDLFLFFFSGHGDQTDGAVSSLEPDGRTESITLRDGDLTDVDMARLFATLDTRLALLVIDSCFSGGFARNVVDRPGVMGLFSSEEDLTSAVADKFEAGGYLAHFLRSALSGEADRDGDQAVTAGELSTYLRRQFAAEVEAIESETIDGQRNYQNLVIDRGGVQVDDVVIRLAAASAMEGAR